MKKGLSILVLVCLISNVLFGICLADEINNQLQPKEPGKVIISAESRVRGLAIKNENERKSVGVIAGALGGVVSLVGISWMSHSSGALSPLAGSLLVLEGLAFIGMGAAAYFIPSGIENDYLNMDKIDKNTAEGRAERELLAVKTLKNKSEEYANGRIWNSSLLGIGSAMLLLVGKSSNVILGGLGLGLSWYGLNNKTEVEKEYDEYLGDKQLVEKEIVIPALPNQLASAEGR